MAIEYYARRGEGDMLHGPFGSYTAAWHNHAMWEANYAGPMIDRPRMQVLVDIGSVGPLDDIELHHVLMSDPVLKTFFELGRQREREHQRERDAERRKHSSR